MPWKICRIEFSLIEAGFKCINSLTINTSPYLGCHNGLVVSFGHNLDMLGQVRDIVFVIDAIENFKALLAYWDLMVSLEFIYVDILDDDNDIALFSLIEAMGGIMEKKNKNPRVIFCPRPGERHLVKYRPELAHYCQLVNKYELIDQYNLPSKVNLKFIFQ
jgi:hypothetical protein